MLRIHQNIPTITAMLNGMGINISTAGVKALIASGHLDSLAASENRAGNNAAGAAGNVRNLAAMINGLHDKSVVITTVFRQLGQAGGTTFLESRGHAAGTAYAAPGLAMVGEQGRELIMFAGGERVLSNPETERFLSSPGGGAPGSGVIAGAATINLTAHINHTSMVDGEALWHDQQVRTLRFNVRNGNPGAGSVAPPVAPL
jgi:hypothetical protein